MSAPTAPIARVPLEPTASNASPASALRTRFGRRLLLGMMLMVSAVTGVALYVAERNLAASIRRELQVRFEANVAGVRQAEAVRHAALAERCRSLVRKPRIHAALEDNALDLLYPSAEDELQDVMAPARETAGDAAGNTLQARFYRFLDREGRIIPAPAAASAGALSADAERALTLPMLGDAPQIGYLPLGSDAAAMVEVIATPIISSETGDVIAALVLGFSPMAPGRQGEMRGGIWVNGRLALPGFGVEDVRTVAEHLRGPLAPDGTLRLELGSGPQQLFFKRLNPDSAYPPAYEVSLFPLDPFATRTARLRVQVVGAGLLLLAAAFVASNALARRLAAPVEKLALESERSARFSADASHQLKTPVTVLRAGLEELLSRENLTPAECDAISGLIHQTYRLSSLIEDLLLLSRMDSGRLRLALEPVDLAGLIAAALDDLSAAPDALSLRIETDLPAVLPVRGDAGYTAIILQNLLENARKYNRPGGRVRIAATIESGIVTLTVGNTGRGISAEAQARIFERFHRGAIGENVPGYGLGLNLARELARLHGGDLRLVGSAADWTEFELRLGALQPAEVGA